MTTMDLTRPIPRRYRWKCEFCQEELDTRLPGIYQWTSGWVMNRDGGGGHGVSLPEREPRFAHRHCVEARTKGTLNQTKMF